MTEIRVKQREKKNLITVVQPGPRALGVQNEIVSVDINPNTDKIEVTRTPSEAAVAPNQARALAVFGAHDKVHLEDIMQAQKGKATERKIIAREGDCDRMAVIHGQLVRCAHDEPPCPRYMLINEMWSNYIEVKARWLAGKSSFGAGGAFQRQRVHQNPATRPVRSR